MKHHILRTCAACLTAVLMLTAFTTVWAADISIYRPGDPALDELRKTDPELDDLLDQVEKQQAEKVEQILAEQAAAQKAQQEREAAAKEKARQEFLAASSQEQVFDDVAPDHWHFPYVMTLYNKGGVSGLGNGCFDPDAEVTAAEFFTIAARLVMPEKIDMSSAEDYWAFPYYDALDAKKLIRAAHLRRTPESLNLALHREYMAELLVSLAQYRGEEIEKLENIENNIDDSALCNEEIFQAYSAGLLTGKGDGTFDPYGKMTRAEMCVVFCRLMNYIPREEVVVQPRKHSDFFVTLPNQDKGKILPEVAHEYLLEAVANMYVGEDENGVYLHATAPALPEELADCTFRYGMDGFTPDACYYFRLSDMPDLKPGESYTAYLTQHDPEEEPLRSGDIGNNSMEVTVYLRRPVYGSSDRHLTVVNSVDDHLQAWDYDFGGSTGKYVPADVSHVFARVKK